tara:strand:+ start:175436 stop:175654 length:219 start_codon:yes stop_codon:yes gene_type:complete
MKELIKRIAGYSKTERLQRLITIGVKDNPNPFEIIEQQMIQLIRQENGEIDEVKRMNAITEQHDKDEEKFNN